MIQVQQAINKDIDFLDHLKATFIQRCRNNKQYSLRAYARSLGIEPSPLSAILNNKRQISEKMKIRLGLALGIPASDLQHYKTRKERIKFIESAEYSTVEDAQFEILADWWHFAILELFDLQDFNSDKKWISKKLGLNIYLT